MSRKGRKGKLVTGHNSRLVLQLTHAEASLTTAPSIRWAVASIDQVATDARMMIIPGLTGSPDDVPLMKPCSEPGLDLRQVVARISRSLVHARRSGRSASTWRFCLGSSRAGQADLQRDGTRQGEDLSCGSIAPRKARFSETHHSQAAAPSMMSDNRAVFIPIPSVSSADLAKAETQPCVPRFFPSGRSSSQTLAA